MSCTTIKVTVIGSPSGVLSIMDAANKAVKDAESARDESFLSRDAASKSSDASLASAKNAQDSASDAAQSALKAKESEDNSKVFADDANTSMVGAKGAMAQAKVYRDQAKQFAGQRTPIEIMQDGTGIGLGVSKLNFAGSGIAVDKTSDGVYKISLAAQSVTWSNLSGKPSTFPPAAHKHAISDVTGLQSALDGKQAAGSYATAAQLGQKLDASKMIIAGSAAKGGEGAIIFPNAGKVTMSVSFLVLNEQRTDSEFSARLVKVADNGAVTPIAGGDLRVKIAAGSKGSIVNLKADTFDVSDGDCVGIQIKSDKVDGCFIESTTPS